MSELSPLDFAVHALRVNGGAPCDIKTADLAEQELHALREDRASIDAVTSLLGKARTERDDLHAELTCLREENAEKDRRIAELTTELQDFEVDQACEERCEEQAATIAAQDAALVAMREALEMIASDMNCADEAAGIGTCRERFPGRPEAWCPPCVAIDALTSTATAAQEAERRILERAWERVVFHARDTGEAGDLEFHGYKAAILGTDQPTPDATFNGLKDAILGTEGEG